MKKSTILNAGKYVAFFIFQSQSQEIAAMSETYKET